MTGELAALVRGDTFGSFWSTVDFGGDGAAPEGVVEESASGTVGFLGSGIGWLGEAVFWAGRATCSNTESCSAAEATDTPRSSVSANSLGSPKSLEAADCPVTGGLVAVDSCTGTSCGSSSISPGELAVAAATCPRKRSDPWKSVSTPSDARDPTGPWSTPETVLILSSSDGVTSAI